MFFSTRFSCPLYIFMILYVVCGSFDSKVQLSVKFDYQKSVTTGQTVLLS